MSVKEALEGLENYITWVEDYPGELVHVDNESTEAKIHLSHVREWVALAQQAYDEGVKTIARLTAALEEARGLVDEAISAGNHGRLDLIRAALFGRGEGSPLSENTEALRLSLLKARDGETLWHKRTVELETSMQRMIFDSPDSCREWIHKRVYETWNRLNALSGKGEAQPPPDPPCVGSYWDAKAPSGDILKIERVVAVEGRIVVQWFTGAASGQLHPMKIAHLLSRYAPTDEIPPDPPYEPICAHCGDTRRVETECGDVICPMCLPPLDLPCEEEHDPEILGLLLQRAVEKPPCECGGSGVIPAFGPGEGPRACPRGCKPKAPLSGRSGVSCPKGCKPEPVDFDTCPHCGKQTALSRECVFDLAEGDSESPPAESACTECGKAFTIERLKCE